MAKDKKKTFLHWALFIVSVSAAQSFAAETIFTSDPSGRVARTDKPFLNDPNEFQFVVIGDRTGGQRPDIFARAMHQINLMRPEFVVSVGDLIEGYSEDPEVIASEWQELDAAVDTLAMPFFYTVGNHDMSNNVMREIWHQRLGDDYYYFTYQDVLFISLNTEDPPVQLPEEAVAGQAKLIAMIKKDPVATQQKILERSRDRGGAPTLPGQANFSQQQVRFVEQTLASHPDVRWTILLMHKPAWQYDSQEFEQIEQLLEGRSYSVIAGHEHYYLYTQRHGKDYVTMGTTGGIWLEDGPGRMDHIAWVTMTDEGPVFANIRLDGLYDKKDVLSDD